MTLVIGIAREGQTALIADSCASYGETNRQMQGGLKLGKLSESGGCIYGITGSARESSEFVLSYRRKFPDHPTASPTEQWEYLRQHLVSRDEADFLMVVASRHTGESRLYILDASKRTITDLNDDLVVKGSGAGLYTRAIRDFDTHIWPWVFQHFEGRVILPHSFRVYCYYLCSFLMKMSHGPDWENLRNMGVGGAFYFYHQRRDGESPQDPAIYIPIQLFELDERRVLIPYAVRIAYYGDRLIIRRSERSDDPGVQASLVTLWDRYGDPLSLILDKREPSAFSAAYFATPPKQRDAFALNAIHQEVSNPVWFTGFSIPGFLFSPMVSRYSINGYETFFDIHTGWMSEDVREALDFAMAHRPIDGLAHPGIFRFAEPPAFE